MLIESIVAIVVLIICYILGILYYQETGWWGKRRLPTLLGVFPHDTGRDTLLKKLDKDQYFWNALRWPILLFNFKKKEFTEWLEVMRLGYKKFKETSYE